MTMPPLRVAINGYGRIGRCVLRALYESATHFDHIEVVAINELADIETMAHLTKYDTTHGRFPGRVEVGESTLAINGRSIEVLHEENPELLPWQRLNIDLVMECTGRFKSRESAEKHIEAGAKRVLFSHPAVPEVDATVVFGVNHQSLKSSDRIISNASCTTNCIVPVLNAIDTQFGIESALITTIHSAMHDQPVIDAYNPDFRKTRSALQSIIPVQTSLHVGIPRILPQLEGKVLAQAIRVPTVNVSMMDLSVKVHRQCDANEVNDALKKMVDDDPYGVFGFSDELLVSADFNHDPRSSIVDGHQTQVCGGKLIKIVTWFDNEWGFSNRMLDTALTIRNV